ncbi:MAG: ribonuclease HII [Pseudomonadota bacterium]
MAAPDAKFEHLSPTPVCGVDEVGRGPWAGPVVAAAVILDLETAPTGLNDSKKLTARRREILFEALQSHSIGVGMASVAEIDEINILNASHLAMRRAVEALPVRPAHALIDGNRIPVGLPCAAECLVKGDQRSVSIAAASIIAKVTRDRLMAELAKAHPGYGWETNAGYGVKAHSEALKRLGVTQHHRRSFKPIHNMLCEDF